MMAALTGIVSIGIAIIFHEGSTLVVVANALRLLRYPAQRVAA
jgi:Cd2+/Zn2+-exporting ATPase